MLKYTKLLAQFAKRRADILAMAQTMSNRQIAAKLGLSVQRVHKIVGKRAPVA